MIRPLRIGDRTLLTNLQESWRAPEPVWTDAENRNSLLDALYCRWIHDSGPSRHYCIITDIWGLLDFSKKKKKNHSPVLISQWVRASPHYFSSKGKGGGTGWNFMTHWINILLAQTNQCHSLQFRTTHITNRATAWTFRNENKWILLSLKPCLKNVMLEQGGTNERGQKCG